VAETTVKRLLCCGFRRTGKAKGQLYQCWWRISREINIFTRFEFTDSPTYNYVTSNGRVIDDLAGSGRGHIETLSQNFAGGKGGTEETHKIPQVIQ
jgi:hypothetical protein